MRNDDDSPLLVNSDLVAGRAAVEVARCSGGGGARSYGWVHGMLHWNGRVVVALP